MIDYEKESELVAYCGIYCRLCDYYTGKIRDSVRNLLDIARKHGELKLFADTDKSFNFENFVKGLEWLAKEISPCVGGCRGGGGWGDCPIRKCCSDRRLRFCFECNDFPCEILKKYPKHIGELNEIMRISIEGWIRRKLE